MHAQHGHAEHDDSADVIFGSLRRRACVSASLSSLPKVAALGTLVARLT